MLKPEKQLKNWSVKPKKYSVSDFELKNLQRVKFRIGVFLKKLELEKFMRWVNHVFFLFTA